MPLKICFISAEVAPLAKTGGLADVSGSLVKYLHDADHDVRLFTPFYSSIDRTALASQPMAGSEKIPLELGAHRYRYSVERAELPGSQAPVYLIDCPELY